MKAIFIIVILTVVYIFGMIQLENYRNLLLLGGPNIWETSNTTSSAEVKAKIEVLIWGQVVESKKISVIEGTRLGDAIGLVGGLSNSADITAINEDYLLKSGDTIYIPMRTSNPKISINVADATTLDQLPGIGSVLATRIINYRSEKGEFMALEELKQVEGIGDIIFNQIKDLICL